MTGQIGSKSHRLFHDSLVCIPRCWRRGGRLPLQGENRLGGVCFWQVGKMQTLDTLSYYRPGRAGGFRVAMQEVMHWDWLHDWWPWLMRDIE